MNIDKLKLFAGVRKEESLMNKRKRELDLQIKEEAAKIYDLLNDPSWELIEKYLENRREITLRELTTCKEKDLHKLQVRAEEISKFFNFLNMKILSHKKISE